MPQVGRAFREHSIAENIINIVEERPGILESAVIEFIARESEADADEVNDMFTWLIEEHQIVRRFSRRGGTRLYPYKAGFAIRRVFPPGSPEHS